MKTFKFKLLPLSFVLLILVMALSIVGVIFNVMNIISLFRSSFTKPINVIGYAFMILVAVLLFIISISITLNSKYQVKKDKIILYFGIFKSKYEIESVLEFAHFKKSDKLVMYFKNSEYTVINVSTEVYGQFIEAVRENNREIIYRTETDGEDAPS